MRCALWFVIADTTRGRTFSGQTVTKMSDYTCALRVNEECLSEVWGFFSVIPFANSFPWFKTFLEKSVQLEEEICDGGG